MDEAVVNKRLFIGGLSKDLPQEELIKRLSNFGKITDFSVKTRTDDQGEVIKSFAHCNIQAPEAAIQKCFTTYQNTKWKGSVLKLQFAKESFLDRLQKEREQREDDTLNEKETVIEIEHLDFSSLTCSSVPGTPVPGKKNWVVGKFGRALPILNVKKSYKLKSIKYDPSKHCHTLKRFKEQEETPEQESKRNFDSLTWELEEHNSEMTKKRRGEFKANPKTKTIKPLNIHEIRKDKNFVDKFGFLVESENTEIEVVKNASQINKNKSVSNRFDSDGEDCDRSSSSPNKTSDLNLILSNNKLLEKEMSRNKVKNSSHAGSNDSKNSSLFKNKNKADTECSQKIETKNKKRKRSTSDSSSDENMESKKHLVNTKKPANKLTSPVRNTSKILNKENVKSSNTDKNTSSSRDDNSELENTSGSSSVSLKFDLSADDLIHKETKSSNSENEETDSSETDSSEDVDNGPDSDSSGEDNKSKKISSRKASNSSKKELRKIPPFQGITMLESYKPFKNDESDSSEEDEKLKKMSSKKVSVSSTKELTKVPPFEGIAMLKNNNTFKTDESKYSQESRKSEVESDCSAATDEILTRCRESLSSRVKPQTSAKDSIKTVMLSEFSASISDYPENPSSTRSNKSSDTSNSDSDLDSNDLELVAKKLAQKEHEKSAKKKKRTKEKSIANFETSNSKFSQSFGVEEKLTQASANPKKAQKEISANDKRLESLKQRQKEKDKQKSLLQEALKNMGGEKKNRIVFASSDEEETKERAGADVETSSDKPSRLLLGNSSDEDSDDADLDEMFRSRPQHEGKQGEKLMKMEKKFADSRFKMDAKFVDNDEVDRETTDKQNTDSGFIGTDETKVLKREKEQSLQVLEKVIGKTTLDKFTHNLNRHKVNIIDMNSVRFDPTKVQKTTKQTVTTNPSEKEDVALPKSTSAESPEKPEAKFLNEVKSSDKLEPGLASLFKPTETKPSSFALMSQFDDDSSDSDSDTNVSAVLRTTKSSSVDSMSVEKRFHFPDNTDARRTEEEMEDSSSEVSDSQVSDEQESVVADKSISEFNQELKDAGRVDIRFTKEAWLARWQEIRPSLVKIYKRKHRDALKSRKVFEEKKRKKDFIRRSTRSSWTKKL